MGAEIIATWDDIELAVDQLVRRQTEAALKGWAQRVYGIPRGGVVPAVMVAKRLHLPMATLAEAQMYPTSTLIVDDLIDSGRTMQPWVDADAWVDVLFRKPHSPVLTDHLGAAHTLDGWVEFPWEADEGSGPEDAVIRLIEWTGDDPGREGLLATPGRVVRALSELTEGSRMDPAVILGTTFEVGHDEMIVVTGIDFTSLCEHHLLPFMGTATVGYLPGAAGRVVGLSKIPRLVECFARRLQIQERMTTQIAEALAEHVDTLGVGVVVKARHLCLACRGARKPNVEMVTSAMLGALREKPEARAEFLALAGQ